MAEYSFQEVMKQIKRICDSDMGCEQCPLSARKTNTGNCCSEYAKQHPADAERIIMDWAAKNPEPRYPTWREWRDKVFSDARLLFLPCHFKKCRGRYATCGYECMDEAIPPDIAAKLGIDPVKFWEGEKHE